MKENITDPSRYGEYPYGYNPYENIFPCLTMNPRGVVTQSATIGGFPP